MTGLLNPAYGRKSPDEQGTAVRAGRQLGSCVCARFYDNESGPRWPGPSWNTKIILNKSRTVGARLVLRQRVYVTAPLFTKMPKCTCIAPHGRTIITSWPLRRGIYCANAFCLEMFIIYPKCMNRPHLLNCKFLNNNTNDTLWLSSQLCTHCS